MDADIRGAEEAPAETADEIKHGIEERNGAPRLRQHVDRVERAAEKDEWRDQQHGDELQLLEVIRPDADDEAEEAEGDCRQHQEEKHQEGVLDLERHKEMRSRKDDQAQDD